MSSSVEARQQRVREIAERHAAREEKRRLENIHRACDSDYPGHKPPLTRTQDEQDIADLLDQLAHAYDEAARMAEEEADRWDRINQWLRAEAFRAFAAALRERGKDVRGE